MKKTATGTKTDRRTGHIPTSRARGALVHLASVMAPANTHIHIDTTHLLRNRATPLRADILTAGRTMAHDGTEVVP